MRPKYIDRLGLTLLALLGLAYFVLQLVRDAEFGSYFVWDFGHMWLWEALLVGGCWSLGDVLLERALRLRNLPRLEAVVAAMALGVAGFVWAMYVAGALGLFRPWLAVALPAALIAVRARRTYFELRAFRWQRRALSLSYGEIVAALFGVLGVTLVYLPMLSPGTVGTDAAWFHLTSAQDYAREGRIVPFLADWSKNIPQLTSIIHTWAFLAPGLKEPQHWVLALHTEFVLFLFTLAGVVATANYLSARSDLNLAWPAFFLFPAIYIYDSNLSGAADHITAFFSLPMLVAALRSLEQRDVRQAVLAGVCGGAAMLTKLQATYLLVPLSLLFGVRAALASIRRESEQRRVYCALGAFLACIPILMLPHCLKNWVFYRNPMYPFFMRIFPSRPAMADAATLFVQHFPPFESSEPFGDRMWRALELSLWFPFTLTNPHGVPRPFVGALFTLLAPTALCFRKPRLWAALFVACTAIVGWAYAFPTPRNLQTFLPVLVALTAALMAVVWNANRLGKMAVFGLVACQLIAAWDLVVVTDQYSWQESLGLMLTGTKAQRATRYEGYRRDFRDIGKMLPKDALLLLHTSYSQLGINRRTLLDWPGFQGLVDYRPLRTRRATSMITIVGSA